MSENFDKGHSNVRKTFQRAPRGTIHFYNFKQKELCEYGSPLPVGMKENIEFFKIQKHVQVTYEHMKLTQSKVQLPIQKRKRKIGIWEYLYVI